MGYTMLLCVWQERYSFSWYGAGWVDWRSCLTWCSCQWWWQSNPCDCSWHSQYDLPSHCLFINKKVTKRHGTKYMYSVCNSAGNQEWYNRSLKCVMHWQRDIHVVTLIKTIIHVISNWIPKKLESYYHLGVIFRREIILPILWIKIFSNLISVEHFCSQNMASL